MRWPRPMRQQPIDGTHADVERLSDRKAQQRVDRATGQPHPRIALERAVTIEWLAGAIDDPAEQPRTHRDQAGVRTRNHVRVGLEPVQIAGRHQIQTLTGKADHFRIDMRLTGADDLAAVAYRRLHAGGFQRETDHAREPPGHRRRRHLGEALLALRQRAFPTAAWRLDRVRS